MIIIWGSRLYGRVDEVPGIFYIATRFGHLWFLPLIPMGSYLMLDTKGGEPQGLSIGFSFKSFALTWLRAVLLLAAVVTGIMTMLIANDPRGSNWWLPAAISAVFTAACCYVSFGKRFRRASYESALKWSEKAKFSDEGKVMLELHFGNITEDEAKALIEEARMQQAEAAAVVA